MLDCCLLLIYFPEGLKQCLGHQMVSELLPRLIAKYPTFPPIIRGIQNGQHLGKSLPKIQYIMSSRKGASALLLYIF